MLQCFKKELKKNFANQKLKKPPLKVAQNSSNPLFSPYCPDCPNGPNRRVPVPKCGLLTNGAWNWDKDNMLQNETEGADINFVCICQLL